VIFENGDNVSSEAVTSSVQHGGVHHTILKIILYFWIKIVKFVWILFFNLLHAKKFHNSLSTNFTHKRAAAVAMFASPLLLAAKGWTCSISGSFNAFNAKYG